MSKPRKTKKLRIDELLLERSLADDLQKARALIISGRVVVDEQRIEKAGTLVSTGATIRLKGNKRFVSRGGDKLAAVFEDLQMVETLRGATVCDVGSSTGGFTDFCLAAGADRVVCIDVGTNQLAWEIRRNPRVTVYEKTDVRSASQLDLPQFDWILGDVSFNSLRSLASAFVNLAGKQRTNFLLLVKPQFELPAQDVPIGGVIDEEGQRKKAVTQVQQAFCRWTKKQRVIPSRVLGRTGNREYFLYFQVPKTD